MLALFTCQSEERQREFNAVSLKSNIGILNIDKNRKNLTENNKKTIKTRDKAFTKFFDMILPPFIILIKPFIDFRLQKMIQ